MDHYLKIVVLKFSLGLFFAMATLSALADAPSDTTTVANDDPHTSIKCFQRPKFIEINYRTLPSINAYPTEFQTGNEDFEANRLIEAKLNVPLVLKDRFKLITQLKYKNESLNLGENNFYDKKVKLNNSGITLAYQWFYNGNHFIGGHASGSLKADEYSFSYYSSILDYSGSFFIGKKTGEKSMAMGVIMGNSLGRFRIAPLLIYENELSNNWHLNINLPKQVTVTKALIPDNLYLKGSMEAIGASYLLKNSLDGFENIEFRRSAIDLKVGLEKEIKDWMWIGLDAGISQPLYSVFVHPGDAARRRVHDFHHHFTPFINLSVFAVPPRALYSKLK